MQLPHHWVDDFQIGRPPRTKRHAPHQKKKCHAHFHLGLAGELDVPPYDENV